MKIFRFSLILFLTIIISSVFCSFYIRDNLSFYNIYLKKYVYNIVKLMLNDVRKRLKIQEIDMGITKEAIEFIIEKGYDINFGARPLKRTIQSEIETMVAKKIIANEITSKSKIQVYVNGEELSVKKIKND